MNTVLIRFLAVCVVPVVLCGSAGAAEKKRTYMYDMMEEKVGTVAGPLYIAPKEEPSETLDTFRHKILLNGKVIAVFEDDYTVYIHDAHPDTARARLLLFFLGTGGTGCPGYFRIMEIKEDGSNILTDKFGTCSDIHKSVYRNGTWVISIPPFVGDPKKPERWEYRDGKLTHNGELVANSSDPDWEWRQKLKNAVPDAKEREALVKKHGNVKGAYAAWIDSEAKRKVRPEQFR